MKVIIAGSRTINNLQIVEKAIKKSKFDITEVVCGEANGVDKLGKIWAFNNKILVKSFPAKWKLYGLSAGYKRNEEMANYADALIAVWDGVSSGTRNMIRIAKKKELKVYIYNVI